MRRPFRSARALTKDPAARGALRLMLLTALIRASHTQSGSFIRIHLCISTNRGPCQRIATHRWLDRLMQSCKLCHAMLHYITCTSACRPRINAHAHAEAQAPGEDGVWERCYSRQLQRLACLCFKTRLLCKRGDWRGASGLCWTKRPPIPEANLASGGEGRGGERKRKVM